MDKLDAMQTFVRVAEAGSFTAVADQLQVARSAITRQIAALEKHLRVKLITRSTRSLTLTSAGAAYLEKCRVILNLVEVAETGKIGNGTITIGQFGNGLSIQDDGAVVTNNGTITNQMPMSTISRLARSSRSARRPTISSTRERKRALAEVQPGPTLSARVG